jgi:hypothetical protein
VWTSRIVMDGERNCTVLLKGSMRLGKVGDSTPIQQLLSIDDLKGPVSLLKVEHVIFAVSEGYEVLVLWDGEAVLPLAGRGRLDFAETRGLTGGRRLALQSVRTKVEYNPNACAFLVLDILKQQETI